MITIIVPVYNTEKYLRRCVDSILNQKYNDYELLLINDGSTDKSKMICEEYAAQDSRIKLVNKTNGGSASARNLGLNMARGEYIAFVDSDDYVHRDYLTIMMDLMAKYGLDLVQCALKESVNYNPALLETSIQEYDVCVRTNLELSEEFCSRNTYLESAVLYNKLYRAELFDGLRFPEGKGIDDEYLSYQLIYRAKRIVKTDAVLYYYFMSENSQMRSTPTLKRLDGIDAVQQQIKFYKENNQNKLANLLLYRYFSRVTAGYYMVKEYFPNEKHLIKQLRDEKRKIYTTFGVAEIPLKYKIVLVIRSYFPKMITKGKQISS